MIRKSKILLADALTVTELANTISVEPAQTAGQVDPTKFEVKDKAGNKLEAFSPLTVVKS